MTDLKGVTLFNGIAIIFALLVVSVIAFPKSSRAERPSVMLYGDSLSSGYGLPDSGDGLAPTLQAVLHDAGLEIEVISASVAGDTSTDGLLRLEWTLTENPDLFILALGANDMLRSINPATVEKNLDAILSTLRQRSTPVLLVGMRAPPNFGEDYVRDFANLYTRLAGYYDIPLYPFLLDGVAAISVLNQVDGIHPNADGVRIIAERLKHYVIAALKQ